MKRGHWWMIGAGVVLAVGILAVARVASGGRISMTLVDYKKWPHGAMVRLTNGTSMTIRYIYELNGTPMGLPLFERRQTSNGWTTTSIAVRSIMAYDAKTGKPVEVFISNNYSAVYSGELKPGQSAEFFVWLEPGGAAKRVGTVCVVPQSRFGARLQGWSNRVRGWLRMKTMAPGQVEVWCPDILRAEAGGPK